MYRSIAIKTMTKDELIEMCNDEINNRRKDDPFVSNQWRCGFEHAITCLYLRLGKMFNLDVSYGDLFENRLNEDDTEFTDENDVPFI